MRILQLTFKGLLVTLTGLLLVSAGAQRAQGQTCPGSTLTYIVRDAKGVAIDAASADLHYEPETSVPYSKWQLSGRDFFGRREFQAPDSVRRLNNKIAALQTRAMCNFKQTVKLQLTFKGKTMTLLFLMPDLHPNQSRSFLVDSLRFQKGTFEIQLLADDSFAPRFNAAQGWRKVAEKKETR